MNFEWGSALASRQDRVFIDIVGCTGDDLSMIRGNLMVPIASVFAPSNLTVRHYCLLDLLSGLSSHCMKIIDQCNLLTNRYSGLWAEGYSYWGYTKYFLQAYLSKFNSQWIGNFIALQDRWFKDTSYLSGGRYYPAPFGDVYDTPIAGIAPGNLINIYPVKWFNSCKVQIQSKALRFNLHTDSVDETYTLAHPPIDSCGKPFVYYTGYSNKYPTFGSQFKALLKRLFVLIMEV